MKQRRKKGSARVHEDRHPAGPYPRESLPWVPGRPLPYETAAADLKERLLGEFERTDRGPSLSHTHLVVGAMSLGLGPMAAHSAALHIGGQSAAAGLAGQRAIWTAKNLGRRDSLRLRADPKPTRGRFEPGMDWREIAEIGPSVTLSIGVLRSLRI
jgi:hypothetical protein